MNATPLDLDYFRSRLQERKRELAGLLSHSAEAAKPVQLDQSSVGRLSRMDALQQQSMALETKRRMEVELQRIDSALRRLESEDYGICIRCEEPIPVERLKIDAAALVCVSCASASSA